MAKDKNANTHSLFLQFLPFFGRIEREINDTMNEERGGHSLCEIL
jgi:hypothetical protein